MRSTIQYSRLWPLLNIIRSQDKISVNELHEVAAGRAPPNQIALSSWGSHQIKFSLSVIKVMPRTTAALNFAAPAVWVAGGEPDPSVSSNSVVAVNEDTTGYTRD